MWAHFTPPATIGPDKIGLFLLDRNPDKFTIKFPRQETTFAGLFLLKYRTSFCGTRNTQLTKLKLKIKDRHLQNQMSS